MLEQPSTGSEWPYPLRFEEQMEVDGDVLVLGGGIAGCWAAIAAAKTSVRVALVEKGASMEDSYRMVQRSAMSTWHGEGSFKDLLLQDEEVLNLISPEELEALFDVRSYLGHLDTIFARLEDL